MSIAFEGATAVGDEFLAQDVLNDQSWLAFLAGDLPTAEGLLERQAAILDARRFHAGYVTYHHGWHHIYLRRGDEDRAWSNLADALSLARSASHPYMLVDCLGHEAVRGLHARDLSVVEQVVAELEQLSDSGCMFDAIRGRARMTLGDLFWELDNPPKAFAKWLEGLQIINRYGESKRYEKSIEDMLHVRRANLEAALEDPDRLAEWRRLWQSADAPESRKGLALGFGGNDAP